MRSEAESPAASCSMRICGPNLGAATFFFISAVSQLYVKGVKSGRHACNLRREVGFTGYWSQTGQGEPGLPANSYLLKQKAASLLQ